jgi:FtsP/CotA-like multicopper oxidase with cupredoxin domain
MINDNVWGEHQASALPPDRWAKVRFQDEPYFRDTVLLKRKESVDVGMVPLDWGNWLMHCHILEHAEAGMRTLLTVEGEGEASAQ